MFNDTRIRTSITGLKALPNALNVIRALRSRFCVVDEHSFFDENSMWPHLYYSSGEHGEVLDAVAGHFDLGSRVSPEEFVAKIFPNGIPVRNKRKKGEKTKKRTVNKAVITFGSGETYTLKGFEVVEFVGNGYVSFYSEQTKDNESVRIYTNHTSVVADEIESIAVDGVNDQFHIIGLDSEEITIAGKGVRIVTSHMVYKV